MTLVHALALRLHFLNRDVPEGLRDVLQTADAVIHVGALDAVRAEGVKVDVNFEVRGGVGVDSSSWENSDRGSTGAGGDVLSAPVRDFDALAASLARELHYDQRGPSAWAKLTDAGRHHYVERTRRAIWRAVYEPGCTSPSTPPSPGAGGGGVPSAARIYVASRASLDARPAMWRAFRDDGWPIISTWIDEAAAGQTECLTELWSRITREVTTATALIFYAEVKDFPLKGAYVEIGMAMAAGVPIFIVLPGVRLEPASYRPVGSWVRHPSVRVFPTVLAALDAACGPGFRLAPARPSTDPAPPAVPAIETPDGGA